MSDQDTAIKSDGEASLDRLFAISLNDADRNAQIVSLFLACIYDSKLFKFNLTHFYDFEAQTREDCFNVIRMKCIPKKDQYGKPAAQWEQLFLRWGPDNVFDDDRR